MSGWNEDNFLEKMMPLLAKNPDAATCPDEQILGAVADGAAPPEVRYAVEIHTAGCAACAELMRRLSEFQPVAPARAKREWCQVERRLDGRMNEFLGIAPRERRSAWWALGWALAPVVAAAVVILWVPKPTAPAKTRIVEVEPIASARVASDKPAPGVVTLADKTAAASSAPAPAAATPAPQTPAPPPLEPVETASTPAPVAQPDAATQPEVAAGPAPTRSAAPAFAPVVATTAGGQPGQPEPPAAPSPAYIHINAGTRVWILLQSTSPGTNGGFTFRGMVLLPVTQGGATLLDRETQVVGTGIVNQGRTTIRIAEFVWQGIRYRLRGSPAGRSSGPGAGPAVEFSSGQVLETWLASPSIYEKVAAATVPQG
jgi:hypothetical protein